MSSGLNLFPKIVVGACVAILGAAGVLYFTIEGEGQTHEADAAPSDAASAPEQTSSIPPAAPAVPQTPYTGQLRQAAVKNCLHQVDRLAGLASAGASTTSFMSNWVAKGADSHFSSTYISQRFDKTPSMPFGVSAIIATPTGAERCDATALRVLPSPLTCEDLQKSLIQKGRLLTDLGGVPVLQTGDSQVLLVPTAGRGCVMVESRTAYDP